MSTRSREDSAYPGSASVGGSNISAGVASPEAADGQGQASVDAQGGHDPDDHDADDAAGGAVSLQTAGHSVFAEPHRVIPRVTGSTTTVYGAARQALSTGDSNAQVVSAGGSFEGVAVAEQVQYEEVAGPSRWRPNLSSMDQMGHVREDDDSAEARFEVPDEGEELQSQPLDPRHLMERARHLNMVERAHPVHSIDHSRPGSDQGTILRDEEEEHVSQGGHEEVAMWHGHQQDMSHGGGTVPRWGGGAVGAAGSINTLDVAVRDHDDDYQRPSVANDRREGTATTAGHSEMSIGNAHYRASTPSEAEDAAVVRSPAAAPDNGQSSHHQRQELELAVDDSFDAGLDLGLGSTAARGEAGGDRDRESEKEGESKPPGPYAGGVAEGSKQKDWFNREPWELELKDCLLAAAKHKTDGNNLFGHGDFQAAATCYAHAVKYVEFETMFDGEDEKLARTLKLHCLLNTAACSLQLGNFLDAVTGCNSALEIDSQSVKAYFRRAHGHTGCADYDAAQTDLERAIALDPGNRELQEAAKKLRRKIRAASMEAQKMCTRIFNKKGDSSSELYTAAPVCDAARPAGPEDEDSPDAELAGPSQPDPMQGVAEEGYCDSTQGETRLLPDNHPSTSQGNASNKGTGECDEKGKGKSRLGEGSTAKPTKAANGHVSDSSDEDMEEEVVGPAHSNGPSASTAGRAKAVKLCMMKSALQNGTNVPPELTEILAAESSSDDENEFNSPVVL